MINSQNVALFAVTVHNSMGMKDFYKYLPHCLESMSFGYA